MTLVNSKKLSGDEFMERIVPHTGFMRDQVLRDMKEFLDAGKDYIMIFRNVEFTVTKAELKRYLATVKDLEKEIGEFGPVPEEPPDEILPPPVKAPAKKGLTKEEIEAQSYRPIPKPDQEKPK